ncbi:hypothetical protein [uncultured Robinsoniella sp.]|uniref:hypothetical protein n=1 Tax=Robinsoniella sp. TaxID=2496533 RepID=UPI00374EE5D3
MKKIIKYCVIFFGILIVIAVIGQALGIIKPNQDTPATEPVVQETPAKAPETETPATETVTEESVAESSDARIKFGDLLDVTENTVENKNICVLKVKIEASLTKGMTVDQNYHNIEHFIKEAGGDKYDSIDYWAVADMEDGSESKVVSFTVPKDTIDKVKSGDLVAIQLKDNVDDLYILPSLQ